LFLPSSVIPEAFTVLLFHLVGIILLCFLFLTICWLTGIFLYRKSPAPQKLKLLSGSCYLPHPAKEATGGEDGHFICIDEQAIGVADGVGGWADHGVDAGLYAKELMSKSMGAIKDEPEGAIDPSRVLEKAFTSTKARGSSTACIITLKEEVSHIFRLS
jgi:protein phosphatase PTC7